MSKNGTLPLLVSIVTYNEELFLDQCLQSLQAQTVETRIKIFDNASSDRTCEIARRYDVELHVSRDNRGYSFGHNHNLRDELFEMALLLNADVILNNDYLEVLAGAFSEVERTGMAGGKLYRMNREGRRVLEKGWPVLDSTGMFFTPSQRHFDRGSEEPDLGRYECRQLVFGITGAALLCSREMLEDVRMDLQYLDEDFFAYREDADLAWRAQLRGWKAVYEPQAVALHFRHVVPSRRRHISRLINYHSLKNRYLMRMKNLDSRVRLKCFPHMWIRDVGIFLYVLLLERRSLPAYRKVWNLRPAFRRKREYIQRRRSVSPRRMARWFSFTPVVEEPEIKSSGDNQWSENGALFQDGATPHPSQGDKKRH